MDIAITCLQSSIPYIDIISLLNIKHVCKSLNNIISKFNDKYLRNHALKYYNIDLDLIATDESVLNKYVWVNKSLKIKIKYLDTYDLYDDVEYLADIKNTVYKYFENHYNDNYYWEWRLQYEYNFELYDIQKAFILSGTDYGENSNLLYISRYVRVRHIIRKPFALETTWDGYGDGYYDFHHNLCWKYGSIKWYKKEREEIPPSLRNIICKRYRGERRYDHYILRTLLDNKDYTAIKYALTCFPYIFGYNDVIKDIKDTEFDEWMKQYNSTSNK